MSEETPEKHVDFVCKICGNHVSLTSARQTMQKNIFKNTKCCNDYCPIHIKCVKNSLVIDRSYKFKSDTYSDDDTMPLYCLLCEKQCFYCG